MSNNAARIFDGLLSVRSFSELVRDALAELRPAKGSLLLTLVIICLALLFASNIMSAENSIERFLGLSSIFREVFLALFGIALSIFAIFFSLLDGMQIVQLIQNDETKDTLNRYVHYYENVLVLFSIGFILNLLVSLMDQALIIKFFDLFCLNRYIEYLVAILYLFLSIRIIAEIKSLLYNTYVITRACLCLKAINAAHGNNSEDDV